MYRDSTQLNSSVGSLSVFICDQGLSVKTGVLGFLKTDQSGLYNLEMSKI